MKHREMVTLEFGNKLATLNKYVQGAFETKISRGNGNKVGILNADGLGFLIGKRTKIAF